MSDAEGGDKTKSEIAPEEAVEETPAEPGADAEGEAVPAEDANRDAPVEEDKPYVPLTFHDPMELSFIAPLPYEITLRSIPNINETRSIWNNGVNELQNVFNQIISKMNMEFDAKVIEFDSVSSKIQSNHEFLIDWYQKMQRKLNEKNDMILLERQKLEAEKDEIRGLVKMDNEVIALNVGGTHHLMTNRDILTLCEGSILEKMFNGMHDNELKKVDEEVFLDRDGKTFLNLVNYLRNDREVFPDFMDHNDEIQFLKELDFWQVPTKYANTK